ncbi:MAG: porin [Rhodospirillaceae bacterium]|nr:porin [Rhodospirillaceae bacterium]
MNKKTLWLSTSALVGAAMIATPAMAGQVGSKDALSVTLGGQLRFQVGFLDQDVSATAGRGYQFKVDESEIAIGAEATADNGLKYGVSIELNAGGADTAAADETYAFIDSTNWGRVELGDQDDATDRIFVESDDILVGRAGPDGDVADFIAFGTGGGISATGNTITGDATKATYFTPRFAGFQLGGSLTPDSGQSSGGAAVADSDSDGDFENVYGIGANYEGKFDDVSFALSLTGEFGSSETAAGAATNGDVETIAAGAIVNFAGFGLGVGYVDLAEQGQTAAAMTGGADSGSYYTVGGSYKTGPWGVSLNWFESSKANTAGISDTDIRIISLDVAYAVAPGWEVNLSANTVSADNINATAVPVNNDGTVVIISNQFDF